MEGAIESPQVDEIGDDAAHAAVLEAVLAIGMIEGGAGRLHQVPGVVPSPRDFPEGDRFAPRSSHPEAWTGERPQLVDVGNDHRYAVVLNEGVGTQEIEVEPTKSNLVGATSNQGGSDSSDTNTKEGQ